MKLRSALFDYEPSFLFFADVYYGIYEEKDDV